MATIKFEANLGAAVRGHIIREIKSFCFHNDYKLTLDEDHGLLLSSIFVKIELPDEEGQIAADCLSKFFNALRS